MRSSAPFSDEVMSALDRLFNFSGPITEYWPLLIKNVAVLLEMSRGAVLRRDRLASQAWAIVAEAAVDTNENAVEFTLSPDAMQAATAAVGKGWAALPRSGTNNGTSLYAIRLGQEEPGCDLVLVLEGEQRFPSAEMAEPAWLHFPTHSVRLQLLRRTGNRQAPEYGQIAAALDLTMLLNEQKQWFSGAMLFCNELGSRYGATRASLGWKRGQIVRLQATSHTNKFEKNMRVVLKLENAMQEALDQDEEVLWPPQSEAFVVCRDHADYAHEQVIDHLLSVPIRVDGVEKGVLTLERNETAFRSVEVSGLRLCCDLAARRLDDLDRRRRGWGVRIKNAAEEMLAHVVGPEHTWTKFAAVAGSVLLAFLVFWPWPDRIDGLFRLNAGTMMSLPAPYEGYIQTVYVRPGDKVRKDQPLIALDQTEIKLQASEALAGQMRYQSEAQLAQVSDRVSDMRIADAQYDQATDRLRQNQYDLSRSELRSPFDGVVVEGDLKERIGAPVKKGEVLMKVCQLAGMEVHVEVPELDIQRIKIGQTGEIAFASRPELKYPIVVDVIEPAAQVRKEGNVFVVRCSFHKDQPEWWRPGMMGVAKINAGTASPLWLLTHRLVDFLELKFWV